MAEQPGADGSQHHADIDAAPQGQQSACADEAYGTSLANIFLCKINYIKAFFHVWLYQKPDQDGSRRDGQEDGAHAPNLAMTVPERQAEKQENPGTIRGGIGAMSAIRGAMTVPYFPGAAHAAPSHLWTMPPLAKMQLQLSRNCERLSAKRRAGLPVPAWRQNFSN